MPAERLTYHSRREQASEALRARGIAALLLSPSSDLAYLAGYRVHTSERLTCLVVGADGGATLLVPELESPRAKAAATGGAMAMSAVACSTAGKLRSRGFRLNRTMAERQRHPLFDAPEARSG